MTRALRLLALAATLVLLQPHPARAEGLRVSPVHVAVAAPAGAGSITVRNDGRQPITVQARIFGWVQQGGAESFVRTGEVAVSPPMTRLAPGAQQTIRIVRTTKRPVRGEEAYRLFVDELPDQTRRQGGTVDFVTRLRLPVFFFDPAAAGPQVVWSLGQEGGHPVLVGVNRGQSHLRVADLRLSRGGKVLARQNGLAGYVLAGATMRFPLSGRISGGATLQMQTNLGELRSDVAAR